MKFHASLLTLCAALLVASIPAAAATERTPAESRLAGEVGQRGWIVTSSRSEKGDWDLFLMRPDGSARRNLTNTPDTHEMGARFSPDGKKLLFRRIAKDVKFAHDNWGAVGELVIANADGSDPVSYGKPGEFPWAGWSPDGTQLAGLARTGIEIWDLKTKQRVRTLPRKGMFEQFFWSPDGQWFTSPADGYGEAWTVVRMNATSGDVNVVAKFQNCTPDFFPDSQRIIYSSRPAHQNSESNTALGQTVGQKPNYGWTQLWMADGDGTHQALVYGEDGRHIYGGALSPDGKYVLFTRSLRDGGMDTGVLNIMRLADAPTIGGESKSLRQLHPATKDGPVLVLTPGWEPHWTYAEIGGRK